MFAAMSAFGGEHQPREIDKRALRTDSIFFYESK
jgi:hypothetical protein